jgi:hypothetical protein
VRGAAGNLFEGKIEIGSSPGRRAMAARVGGGKLAALARASHRGAQLTGRRASWRRGGARGRGAGAGPWPEAAVGMEAPVEEGNSGEVLGQRVEEAAGGAGE